MTDHAASTIAPAQDGVKIEAAPPHAQDNGHNGATTESKKRPSKSPPRADADGRSKGSTKKRRKVNHACVYCRRSHMTCDLERPCTRCIKRNIGHLCHDEPRETPKKLKADDEAEGMVETTSPSTGNVFATPGMEQMHVPFAPGGLAQSPPAAAPKMAVPTPQPFTPDPSHLLGYDDWNSGFQNSFHDMHTMHPNYMFNNSEVSNEYSLMTDFLSNSMADDGVFYPDNDPALFPDPSLPNTLSTLPFGRPQYLSSHLGSQQQPATQATTAAAAAAAAATAGNSITRPASRAPMDKAREEYYMAAADPDGTDTPEERMTKLLKAKYDAGLLKPFNYVQGYTRLTKYLEQFFQTASRQRIARQMDKFRPKFRERIQKLTDIELVMVEMWFERSLMEYDRVFASMAIPACCWRRTGEIFRGNREMAELIHVPIEQLRDGKLAIHDIIVEDSLVSYWEKFGAIAFDATQKAILTSCSLKSPRQQSQDPDVRCCFSFTIRRDQHHIPSLIIGHFLPILPRNSSSS